MFGVECAEGEDSLTIEQGKGAVKRVGVPLTPHSGSYSTEGPSSCPNLGSPSSQNRSLTAER